MFFEKQLNISHYIYKKRITTLGTRCPIAC